MISMNKLQRLGHARLMLVESFEDLTPGSLEAEHIVEDSNIHERAVDAQEGTIVSSYVQFRASNHTRYAVFTRWQRQGSQWYLIELRTGEMR